MVIVIVSRGHRVAWRRDDRRPAGTPRSGHRSRGSTPRAGAAAERRLEEGAGAVAGTIGPFGPNDDRRRSAPWAVGAGDEPDTSNSPELQQRGPHEGAQERGDYRGRGLELLGKAGSGDLRPAPAPPSRRAGDPDPPSRAPSRETTAPQPAPLPPARRPSGRRVKELVVWKTIGGVAKPIGVTRKDFGALVSPSDELVCTLLKPDEPTPANSPYVLSEREKKKAKELALIELAKQNAGRRCCPRPEPSLWVGRRGSRPLGANQRPLGAPSAPPRRH
eukprot:gene23090-19649_t